MLKLSKTTSAQKLFDYDCVMLYERRAGPSVSGVAFAKKNQPPSPDKKHKISFNLLKTLININNVVINEHFMFNKPHFSKILNVNFYDSGADIDEL